jgi:hemerythrin-like domain-containing protein
MDAVALLVADHNRVRGLVARYEDAHDSGDLDEAAKLVAKIVEELEVHMAIEEEVFYPAIHELKDEIGESVDEGIEEHHVAKVLIKELGSLQPTDESWVAKVTVLIESVEHHVDEEEEELFPRVRGASNAAWLKVLAGKLEVEEEGAWRSGSRRQDRYAKVRAGSLGASTEDPGSIVDGSRAAGRHGVAEVTTTASAVTRVQRSRGFSGHTGSADTRAIRGVGVPLLPACRASGTGRARAAVCLSRGTSSRLRPSPTSTQCRVLGRRAQSRCEDDGRRSRLETAPQSRRDPEFLRPRPA